MDYQLLYLKASQNASLNLTKDYSTSFYKSICLLDESIRQPIFNIYGMVRIADEIVDTYQDREDIATVFDNFEKEVWQSIDRRYSPNIILHSFQQTYHDYKIDGAYVAAFLYSMKMDLSKRTYTKEELKTYIYGSAEVVGLMCLQVFCYGYDGLYEKQKESARYLGSFFQKINFLRDIASDYQGRERIYFSLDSIDELQTEMQNIIHDMKIEMQKAKQGIKHLPRTSRLGVYVACQYYQRLLIRIEKLSAEALMHKRISVPTLEKFFILFFSKLKFKLRLI